MILSHVDPLPHLFYDLRTEKAYTTFSRNGKEAIQHAEELIHKHKKLRKDRHVGISTTSYNAYENNHDYDEDDSDEGIRLKQKGGQVVLSIGFHG